jgi:hypothetical protein
VTTILGLPEFVSTLDTAASKIETLDDVNADVSQMMLAEGSGAAPVYTGALAASFRASVKDHRPTITSTLVYAVPIHWGRPAHNIARNPFAIEAIAAADPAPVYDPGIQRILDRVRGV